ncbi:MAG: FAD:protein FMN transferase [Planctomycetota bacterium]
MGRILSAGLVGLLLAASAQAQPKTSDSLKRFEFSQIEMAVQVRVVLYAPDEQAATSAADAAFARFRALNAILSDYDPESELRKLCDTAGGARAVPVSDDLWKVLSLAQQMSRRTEGAFDVTISPVIRLWRQSRRFKELPKPEKLKAALDLVGYKQVRLVPEEQAIELLKPGMRLDVGGIAKGYAVAAALEELEKHGIQSALVEAGGDIGASGAPPGEKGWRIAVAPPAPQSPPREMLLLANKAVATSGDMWQFVIIDGVRYSHIVDPRTGLGLTDHSNVTVVHRESALADALSTAVSVLGPQKGLELIEATPEAAALIVRQVEGRVEVLKSKNWDSLPHTEVSADD